MTTTDNKIPLLRLGTRGAHVVDVQRALNSIYISPTLALDGIYGPKTVRQIEIFQKSRGLEVDGIVGPRTWDALFPPKHSEYPSLLVPMHPGRIGAPIKPRGIIWHYTAMSESTEMALAKVWSQSRGKGNGATCIVRRNGQIIQLCDFFHNANHAGGGSTGRIYFTEAGEHLSNGKGHHPNTVCIGVELSNPGRVRRSGGDWIIAYTGAEKIPVDSGQVITDATLGTSTRETWGWFRYTEEQISAARKIVEMARAAGVINENVYVVRQKVKGVDYGVVQKGSMELGHNDLDPSRKDDPGPLWRAADLTGEP